MGFQLFIENAKTEIWPSLTEPKRGGNLVLRPEKIFLLKISPWGRKFLSPNEAA